MKFKLLNILSNVIMILAVSFMGLVMYAAYLENEHKQVFDDLCKGAGGIPLRYTYHYDHKQNQIEYTCLSVNAVIDVE